MPEHTNGISVEKINLPNFFILGAAKSGTTSLHAYLNQHPEVFLSQNKEPSFFCSCFQVISNPIDYFHLFSGASNQKVIGEASHVYMTDPATPPVLHALFPSAKFVVILRNPADRAFSLYHHMRRRGYETAATFEKALEMEDDRYCSQSFKDSCPQYFYNFMYFRSGLYGEQLSRYLSYYDRSNFHILSLDALKTDPASSLRGIFSFLGVNEDFSPDLSIKNEGGFTARIPFLQHLFRVRLNRPNIVKKLGLSLMKRINRIPSGKISPSIRSILLDKYSPDLRLVKDISGLSL